MKIQSLAALAIAAAFAAPTFAQDAPAAGANEKCYGVAKAGKNDCASAGNNSCAGTSTKDADGKAWMYVPAGLCAKIVGGSTEAKS